MYPTLCPLDVNLVLALHDCLRKNDIGENLPYASLAVFLEFTHDRANTKMGSHMMTEVVRGVLRDIALANTLLSPPRRTPSGDNDQEANWKMLVSAARATLQTTQYYLTRAADIREQHGGITAHDSIDALMRKVGNTVDKTVLMALVERVAAINAQQSHTPLMVGAEQIEELCELLAACDAA
jgi:hypothetical protein